MKINNKSILVIGDAFLDIFGEYDTIKISPEAPIPIIKKTKNKFFIGGAANVANNIKSIGGKVFLISRGSNDKNSYKLKKLLFKNKINHIFFKEPGYPTIIKERYFSQNQQLLRVDNDKISPINLTLEKKIITFIKKNINISSDFDPLEYAIKLGHSFNLEIHVWMNCYILWSDISNPLDKEHILYTKPLWTESDIYGKLDDLKKKMFLFS